MTQASLTRGMREALTQALHKNRDAFRDLLAEVMEDVSLAHAPARYDEELSLTTRVVKQTHVRIDQAYELKRGETLLAEASSTIAGVDRAGQLQQIPEFLHPRN